MELMPKKEKSFLSQNIIFILLGAFFCIFGRDNQIVLILGYSVFVVGILTASIEHKFCWSLFFISNIRLFDNLGTTILVNILLVLPLVFYFIKKMILKDFNLLGFPLIGAVFLCLIEKMHINQIESNSARIISWGLSFVWCCYASLDKKVDINKNDVIYSLSAGIIMSAAISTIHHLMANGSFITDIFSGYRFEGYGSDPNYYSLYICLALSSFVIKPKIQVFDYIMMVILISIGFLTASKMYFLLMLIIILYFIASSVGNLNKFLKSSLIICVSAAIVYLMIDYIIFFLANLLDRAGGNQITLESFSTGRFGITMKYLDILSNDFSTLFFGKGFDYHLTLPSETGHGSHNTYLDFILAWGILGTIVLFVIFGMWFNYYKKKQGCIKFTKKSKFPFFVLGVGFLALSCFSANMFFYIITAVLLQTESEKTIEDGNVDELRQIN